MAAAASDSARWGPCLAEHAGLFRPPGPGPFPVVLILHGCGGRTPFLDAYAAVAVAAGYAAVVVDSLQPRGLSRLDGLLRVCSGVSLRGVKRAADLFALLNWLETQAWADPDHVVLAGWSHGAWTIMDGYALGPNAARATGLIDADPAKLRARVKAALLVYPYAAYPSLTANRGWGDGRPRVYSVLAGRDQVVGQRHARRALERLTQDGLAVDTLYFPDATHAFDDDRANDPRARHRPDLFAATRDYFARMLAEARRSGVAPR